MGLSRVIWGYIGLYRDICRGMRGVLYGSLGRILEV